MNYSFSGQEKVFSPQLVYYKDIIEQNISRMAEIAGDPKRLWPHVKTHKMAEMVKLQLAKGIRHFKCATIAEAQMCAEAGAEALLLAYPLVGPNLGRFLTLCQRYPGTVCYAMSDNTEQAALMGKAALEAGTELLLMMDVDIGQHRTGVPLDSVVGTYRSWAALPGVRMCGLHCYDGHRHEQNYAQRLALVEETDKQILAIKEALQCGLVILGGTPSFPCHAALTEEALSPGTCVIQDADYQRMYPDMHFTPGAAVLTRVISRPGRREFTLDMGTKAVASDPAVKAVIAGMEYAETVLHNEEHWVVRVPEEHIADIPPIGAILFAVPSHICPTTALYPSVPVIENGGIIGEWTVTARNRCIGI